MFTRHPATDATRTPRRRVRPRARTVIALSTGAAIGSIGVVGLTGESASAIVDGEPTTVEANPWQVALTSRDGQQFCGGSIVSDRVIVTAAHCTQGTPTTEMKVRAGITDLRSGDGQVREVTQVIEHPEYVDGVGDIAMLVLDRPLDMNGTVAAIELATAGDVSAASSGRVTGWGTTSETADDTPKVLQSTDVPLVSDADCGLVEEGNADELCAGGTGTDTCYGDSGGPLTVATDDGQKLAGVTSWGDECGGESAGVYAEVPTFARWIAERIDDPDAPAPDRLPAPEYDDAVGDAEFGDGDVIEVDDDFVESVGGFEVLDAMSDEEFFDAYDDWMASRDDGPDDQHTTESMEDDSADDAFDDEWSHDGTVDGFGDMDTNGDDIVQWSEIADADTADEFDLNGDGIVNWSELTDA